MRILLLMFIFLSVTGIAACEGKDTTPPVISGVSEITTSVGENVSYKRGIEVTDDRDADVSLEIDKSKVDLNTVGDYPVIYSATDSAGNTATVETVLHVTESASEKITEAEIQNKADEIVKEIITEDMSEKEMAKAIFDWCHELISYSDSADESTEIKAAYNGLFLKKGSCATYATTAKYLLSAAGIKNMDIEKQTEEGYHCWNLIDIGDGWFHFDTTKRIDGSSFFYVTDEELMKYSEENNNSHAYDRTKYTDIK